MAKKYLLITYPEKTSEIQRLIEYAKRHGYIVDERYSNTFMAVGDCIPPTSSLKDIYDGITKCSSEE